MNREEVLKEINSGRDKVEAAFVFAVWNDPEQYEDYPTINVGKDTTLINEDAKYYWQLGKKMYEQGFKVFDSISIDTFLTNKTAAKKKYDSYGGYSTVRELKALTNADNTHSYYDDICKRNSLIMFFTSTEAMFKDVKRFENATNEDVYNAIELLNSSIALNTGHEVDIETLQVTQQFIDECKSGMNVGLNYGKQCPILNYTTLGLPCGDCTLLAGHSGTGKSSFAFDNMIIPLAESETDVAIFSNEMAISAYQNMLLAHILTHELNYWKLTRKKIKAGQFTDTDLEMVNKALEISQEKHKHIFFVKLFNNDASVIMKYMKKLAHQGVKMFLWDTFKSDDISDGGDEWLQLLKNSRKIFNLTSKLDVAMVMTFQLALYTTNQRFLDASCLAGSKQIKEVVSELIMFRRLWQDEYSGEKFDCKPYQWDKTHKIKEMIELDPEKKYIVAFINKTRNDDDGNQILYQWDGAWNYWREIGYCTIKNDHKGAG